MLTSDWLQVLFYGCALLALALPLGHFLARVFTGRRTFLTFPLGWLECGLYRLAGIDSQREMGWREYAGALLTFNAWGFLAVFGLQLAQGRLPLNPQHLPHLPWPLALNTAVSFMTNTNWQAYGGETMVSYLTQMLGLAVQNFLSAATGMAVLLALIRGLLRCEQGGIGNFWQDLVRTTVYVLLPLSFLLAVALAGQGVVQNFSPYAAVKTLEGGSQSLPLGPAASQIAIKQLGTNGGGYYNTNSAHPFENPTPFSNFLEMLALLLLPAAQVFMFGKMIGRRRQGLALFATMLLLLGAGLGLALQSESAGNPALQQTVSWEGKEVRLGMVNSILWTVVTTCASNGSVNSMIESQTPLAGGVAMLNLMLGEVTFGGIGAGLYGMLLFALLTVFIAGLMVGRTPEYLGKKIEAGEMQMVVIGILAPSAAILIGAGIAAVLPQVWSSLANAGPHGLSSILYAFSSAAGNNGSAFAGLNANTLFFNLALAAAMLIGRFAVILPALAIAGSLAAKKITPPSLGTFPTDGPLFTLLLAAVVVVVGGLTFLPALALGPLVEHLLMLAGQLF